jgi:hypothetical protein
MLPRINTQNRPELPHHRILVRVRPNLHTPRLRVLNQPCPSAPLDTSQRSVELLFERVQTAIALVDRLAERTCRGLAAALVGGRQVLPEQGVVEVAAAVEVDHGLQGDLSCDIGLGFGFGDLLGEVVVRGYVGVVVVFVVELHDFTGDGGLESAVVVCIVLSGGITGYARLGLLTLKVGKSGLSTNELGACEASSRDGGSGGPCGRAQGRCA